MSRLTHACLTLMLAGGASSVNGQTPPPTPANSEAGFAGEVTGSNVYVRSGPSENYYPVARLQAGQRVTVVGEDHGWYAIVPPAGCYSLIHKNYVDIGEDNEGVVNGDAVRVRAGSTLSGDRYATQLKLDRGAMVKVIEPDDDDFLRIVPPDGVKLYIHEQFVQRVPASRLATEGTEGVASTPAGDEPASQSGGESDTAGKSQPGLYKEEVARMDAALEAELGKPLIQRDYDSLIDGYRTFAEQDVDAYSKVYAQGRIKQLERAAGMLGAVKQLRELSEQLTTVRKDALHERAQVRPPSAAIGGGFDATGELRRSMVFSFARPERYRLVDVTKSPPRTVCYLEVPDDSGIDVTRFLGRRVGVRARQRQLEIGDVDPIPVLTAAELVVLDAVPPEQMDQKAPAPAQVAPTESGSDE